MKLTRVSGMFTKELTGAAKNQLSRTLTVLLVGVHLEGVCNCARKDCSIIYSRDLLSSDLFVLCKMDQ